MLFRFRDLAASVAAAATLTTAGAAAAATQTLTFDEFATDEALAFMGTFSSGGYTFASSIDASDAFGVWGRNSPNNTDPGGAAIATLWSHTRVTVSRADGALFSLKSIDLSGIFGDNAGGPLIQIEFFGPEILVPTWKIVQLPETDGAHTFTFDRDGLTSFVIIPFNTFYGVMQFDNVVVDAGAAAVPEPAVWAMMILGFAATGVVARRRPPGARVAGRVAQADGAAAPHA